MKYYTYISKTKVDMLYSQIPSNLLESLAIEFKIDLKLVSSTITKSNREESLYTKTDLVSKYIEKHFQVGALDSPNEYFRGVLPVKTGIFPQENPKMVYFGGETSRSILGLAGSIKHMIGQETHEKAETYNYYKKPDMVVDDMDMSMDLFSPILHPIMEFAHYLDNSSGAIVIMTILSLPVIPFVLAARPLLRQQIKRFEQNGASEDENLLRRTRLAIIYHATDNLRGLTQNIEFLAKRLIVGYDKHSNKQIILGSPIYVALTN